MRTLVSLGLSLSLVAVYQEAGARDTLVVMTQNQYLGADFADVVTAPDPVALNQAVLEALAQIQANNFPERAQALAEEIADHQPEVVGLQEVFSFTLNGQHGAAPYRDHLTDTLHALNALGASYVAVASVQNTQLTLPVDFNGDTVPDAAVGVTDRDVILVRNDILASAVPFSQVCAQPSQDDGPGCNYQVFASTESIDIKRGFVGVDVTVEGRPYRVVNTHLELRDIDPTNPLAAAIQAAQAAELIGTLQATTPVGRTIVVLGDFNSSPEHTSLPIPPFLTPYQQLEAYAHDTWLLRPGNAPGLTCCQQENLLNQQSELYERVDLIFSTDLPRKVKARLLGNRVADKTRPHRLWPSDHAAVVAELTFD
jgi:endonuclease/exonuclease/phosphatase family metal-dependent hydrolase